jgi:hypothetical protein
VQSPRATSYAAALEALHQAPNERFVEERRRLAAALAASGDSAGSQRLAKQKKPSVTVWAVNQLWWRERDAFEELFATAASLRDGDLTATADHRGALQRLRDLAATILVDAGHRPNEGALRRIATTLSALAAEGGFGADAAGTLERDRDPPGFSGFDEDTLHGLAERAASRVVSKPKEDGPSKAELAEAHRRAERERAQRQAERERLEGALRSARADVASAEQRIEELRGELARAERALEEARDRAVALGERIAELGPK